nr:30S ribosome-binding factor RbfA [Maliibacterium massiliense]
MSDRARTDRVSVEMQREISDIILHTLKDPRITGIVSVTHVEVTRDMSHAKVRISVYGAEDARACQASFDAIVAAGGFIRRELGARMGLRHIPQLHFALDTSIAYGIHMAKLIDDVIKQDQSKE